jgi:GPH family glycoside/pentoside/hexuronide:cation symporter
MKPETVNGRTSKMADKQPVPGDKLKFSELLAYGSGDFGMSFGWSLMGGFASFFLTTVVGLSAAIAGTIFLVSRLFDAASDVIVGTLVDRTHTKQGKARPWMFRAALPAGISLVLFFTAPEFNDIGKIIWVFLTYNLMSTVCYTCANIPYGALSPLMTRDPGSRVGLNISRMLCAILSGVISSSITLPIVNSLGGGSDAWFRVSIVFAAVMTLMILAAALFSKERYGESDQKKVEEKLPLKTALGNLLKNKYWAIMTGCMVIFYMMQNTTNGVNVYYFTYILDRPNSMGLAAIAMALPMLIGIMLAPLLVKKFGKRNLARVSALGGVIGPLLLLANPTSLTFVLIKCVISGIMMAPFTAVGFAMIADVCDYGYWKTGVRAEGLINSAISFGSKFGTGIGAGIVGWGLAAGGFDGALAIQPDSALGAMKFLMIGTPIIINILQFVLLCFYKLDREYPAIIKEIKEREGGEKG